MAWLVRCHVPAQIRHNANHILDCLNLLQQNPPSDPAAHFPLALFFHDAIYDPRRSDNEQQSAALAAAWLAPHIPAPTLDLVRSLILATRHSSPPANPAEALIIDIDLSILGRPAPLFLAYDRAIRAEYAHVPDAPYRTGRAKVLQSFLNRPRIFHTPAFLDQFETAAQTNLRNALSQLLHPGEHSRP